ncbi:membrane-spanning 4-domains subfamily A member 6A-like [Macrotis lagotis]|uniref:membrane-spanning 4-domains subfamily A member 6A-like n=1 Tax=Macrotis lagotis TaxID=92651 RepID=UPI003D694528
MTSQAVPSGMFMIVTPNGISIPQMEQPASNSEANNNLGKRLKEESKALGTIQILTGLMILSVGIILACLHNESFQPSYSKIVKSGYPFIGSVSFIISGSLSIASEREKTKSLNRASLAANMISGVEATAGILLFSVVLPELHKDLAHCIEQINHLNQERQDYDLYHHHYLSDWPCQIASSALTGTLSVMLIFSGLELCSAVFVALFEWRRLSGDSGGSVLFLPHGRHINSSFRTPFSESNYEELEPSV